MKNKRMLRVAALTFVLTAYLMLLSGCFSPEPWEVPPVEISSANSTSVEPTPSVVPTSTPRPTPAPTLAPTPEPTLAPTPEPTAEPTPEPTPKPTPAPTAEPQKIVPDDMVWISSSGTKYHSRAGCSNMKNPWQVTRSEAEAQGRAPCKKCW